ncbi:Uncharacterized protein Adt_11024 [Abeliophyllum distichum]|uniref:Uncharacterized protein n=1 Tax=Abeliophyllum distichum TaxID=126358 RepID=A0ABD1ULV9_9LAMI
MGAAECLIDIQSEPRKEQLQVNSQYRGGGNRSFKSTSNSNGRERYSYYKGGHQDGYQNNHHSSHWNKGKALENKSSTVPRNDGYFLCDGPHRVKDCSQKQFVNALNQLTSRTSGSKKHVLQASSCYEADFEEDKDVFGVFSHRCSTISHRVIEKGKISQKKVEKEGPKPCVCKAKSLMYIDVKINEKPIKDMVDIVLLTTTLHVPK